MIWAYMLAILYFVILGLFTWYGLLNVKQSKTIQEWNESTKHEIEVIRERNLELELRVKELKKALDPIESEPDVEYGRKDEPWLPGLAPSEQKKNR